MRIALSCLLVSLGACGSPGGGPGMCTSDASSARPEGSPDQGAIHGPGSPDGGTVIDLAGTDGASIVLGGDAGTPGDAGPTGDASTSPLCAGITCDGHGTCEVADGKAQCHCDLGYASHLIGNNCQPATGTPCDGVLCGNGSCVTQIYGGGLCQCDPGYLPYGAKCTQERRIACRNTDGSLASRGTTRCGADGKSIDTCRDTDGDGLVEWAFGADCANGLTCATGCLTAGCDTQPCPIGTACVPEAHGMTLNVCVPTCDCTNCGTCGPGDFQNGSEQAQCGTTTGSTPTKACNSPCPDASQGCIPYSPSICWPIEGCFSAAP